MNAKQKLHQVRLQEWAGRFAEQKSSGLTVRQGVKVNIFPFTPITTGSIFSKKKLSIRYFLILFQFLSLQSLSTSLHSKQQKLAQFALIARFERISPL